MPGPRRVADRRRAPGTRASSPFTSVPSGWPAPGCTTSPAGLATTSTSSSSWRTTTGTDGSGRGSPATAGSAEQLDDARPPRAGGSWRRARRRRGPRPRRSAPAPRCGVHPVSSATARSTRSPAERVGDRELLGSTGVTATLRRVIAAIASSVRHAAQITSRIAPIVIAESATLNVGNRLDVHEVDDRAPQEPGRPEHAVDQVADRAAEHQRRARRPSAGRRCGAPPGRADREHDREDREQRRERLEQAERAAGVAGQREADVVADRS